jgi:hypothetical protein
MSSVITNIYNKKIEGHNLMKLFTATGKLKKFFFGQLDMLTRVWQQLECHIDVCRVIRDAHIEHLLLLKKFFIFPVAVNNSIKVGPSVFLLYMFVITENIMKRPVFVDVFATVVFSTSNSMTSRAKTG